jgi:hypothetical protein
LGVERNKDMVKVQREDENDGTDEREKAEEVRRKQR